MCSSRSIPWGERGWGPRNLRGCRSLPRYVTFSWRQRRALLFREPWMETDMGRDGSARLPKVSLGEVLEYLWALSRDEVRPDDALRRLHGLREGYAECGVDLLWEEDPYSKTTHYDVL